MKKVLPFTIALLLLSVFSGPLISQEYTFNDFVGTWHGTISSQSFGGYSDPISMTIESNGSYTETSGHLMPTIYPNSQQCEFETSTNRFHWWYLQTIYGGQYFYQHFFYEIVYFSNDTLEMHYNFWDDPEPHPEVGTIFLVKENLSPPPNSLASEVTGSDVILSWDAPVFGNGSMANPESYNVYYKFEDDAYVLVDNTSATQFTHENVTSAGTHNYYVTAVYDDDESDPSNIEMVVLQTPAPTDLEGQLLGNNVPLYWSEPTNIGGPMAGLLGYNIYHQYNDGVYELLMYVETNGYAHQNIEAGVHTYYVTAVYDGGESDPSNEVEVELVISGMGEQFNNTTLIYPNPATNYININLELDEAFDIRLEITDITGKIYSSINLGRLNAINNHKIDISDIPKGVYFLKVIAGTVSFAEKVIITK